MIIDFYVSKRTEKNEKTGFYSSRRILTGEKTDFYSSRRILTGEKTDFYFSRLLQAQLWGAYGIREGIKKAQTPASMGDLGLIECW